MAIQPLGFSLHKFGDQARRPLKKTKLGGGNSNTSEGWGRWKECWKEKVGPPCFQNLGELGGGNSNIFYFHP